ncbi:MAG TPA: hypothetical protein VLG48_08385 [Candidatus Methylomirabilis sp.]|nr:hypothetical protein [Candidatus Methylomirabilis sp.]
MYQFVMGLKALGEIQEGLRVIREGRTLDLQVTIREFREDGTP